jgi:hypothetical protein
MFWIIFLVIALWVLYKLVFQFVIPVYRSTKVMRQKFRDMHQQMHDQMNQSNPTQFSNPPGQKVKPDAPKGDYIEFEEIKE